jgi:hypothetical protein
MPIANTRGRCGRIVNALAQDNAVVSKLMHPSHAVSDAEKCAAEPKAVYASGRI